MDTEQSSPPHFLCVVTALSGASLSLVIGVEVPRSVSWAVFLICSVREAELERSPLGEKSLSFLPPGAIYLCAYSVVSIFTSCGLTNYTIVGTALSPTP